MKPISDRIRHIPSLCQIRRCHSRAWVPAGHWRLEREHAVVRAISFALWLFCLLLPLLARSDEAAPQHWATFSDELQSGGYGPTMIGVNGGRFRMGCVSNVGCLGNLPVREVSVAPFALSIYEVTRSEFQRFVEHTGYRTEPEQAPRTMRRGFERNCISGLPNMPGSNWGHTWRNPGYAQADDHPVVCVSWSDAQEYVQWLAAETDRPYRLPSEAEWEYAARAGKPEVILSETDASIIKFCRSLQEKKTHRYSLEEIEKCIWPYGLTLSVSAYKPNAFGLYALTENAVEWTEDCWHPHFRGAPEDSSAWRNGACRENVVRMGELMLNNAPVENRGGMRKQTSHNLLGFRVALPTSD